MWVRSAGRGFAHRVGRTSLFVLACAFLAGPALGKELTIAGETVAPGEKRRIGLETSESFAGVRVQTPVVVIRGERSGPVLCLTAGVHGDELVGVEVVRRLAEDLAPRDIRGTVLAVPIANPQGFRRSSRYLPDRRDLNRYFPGRALGSAASRIAYRIFDSVIRHCDYLVDFHTGSFHRTNVPHVRANLQNTAVAKLAGRFHTSIVIHSEGRVGTLRRAAVDAGIPAITFEAGEPMRFQIQGIEAGVDGTMRLLSALQMLERSVEPKAPPDFYYRSRWVRVDEGGILLTEVVPGARVAPGDTLGTVTDPISNHRQVVTSPFAGRIVGMALGQVVIPGFAAFHIAIEGARLGDSEPDEEAEGDPEQDGNEESLADEELRPEE